MTTLHSGGKFGGKVYETSGGLHGVGVSVVNALAEELVVEVARDRQGWRQRFARGKPRPSSRSAGPAPNRRGTMVTFQPDPEIFGKHALRARAALSHGALQGLSVPRRRDPLEMRPRACSAQGGTIPEEESLHFPGGLRDFLKSELGKRTTIVPQPFAGEAKSETNGTAGGKVEWAIAWPADEEAFVRSYCNTIPTPEGGTHERRHSQRPGARAERYGELTGNRKGSPITADDMIAGAAAVLSVFIEQPQFQGQTKEKLVAPRRPSWSRPSAGTTSSTGSGRQGSRHALLEHVVGRAEERLRRRQDREQQRKTATRKLRLPGKLADCSQSSADGTEIFLVEGNSAGGSAKAARKRETQAILPLRGKILNVASASAEQAAREPGDAGPHPGAGLRHRRALQRRGAALRAGHHHDRRRCRRRPHRLAADDLLLSRDAEADRERPPLPRPATALPPQRAARIEYARDEQHKDELIRGAFGDGKVEITPLQGAGRDAVGAAAGDHHGPGQAHAAQGRRADHAPIPRRGARRMRPRTLVEDLMGRKPEKRYAFIQENAQVRPGTWTSKLRAHG